MSKKTEIAELGKLLGGLQIIRSISTALSAECDCKTQRNQEDLERISSIANALVAKIMKELDRL